MMRFLGMNFMHELVIGFALFVAACGGAPSVASKSAAAYDEAKARGVMVGGGHEHGGHEHGGHEATTTGAHAAMQHEMQHDAMPEMSAMDHSAHGAMSAGEHAAMNHNPASMPAMSHDAHAGMQHDAMPEMSAMDHSAHGAMSASEHAAMNHDTASMPAMSHDAHAGMQHDAMPEMGAMDHSAHGAMSASEHATMNHKAAPMSATSHDMHAAMQHGATSPPSAPPPPPASNQQMQRMQPATTLQRDAFDAPSAQSLSEVAKARGDHDMSSAASESLYACPMHPEVTSDKPGTCPKCGMTLVKKK